MERTRAGLEVARRLGRKGGRRRQMTDSKIESAKKLLANGMPPRDEARSLSVSVPTLYRWIPASAQPLQTISEVTAIAICVSYNVGCHRVPRIWEPSQDQKPGTLFGSLGRAAKTILPISVCKCCKIMFLHYSQGNLDDSGDCGLLSPIVPLSCQHGAPRTHELYGTGERLARVVP